MTYPRTPAFKRRMSRIMKKVNKERQKRGLERCPASKWKEVLTWQGYIDGFKFADASWQPKRHDLHDFSEKLEDFYGCKVRIIVLEEKK